LFELDYKIIGNEWVFIVENLREIIEDRRLYLGTPTEDKAHFYF